jgi:hypothetical protein
MARGFTRERRLVRFEISAARISGSFSRAFARELAATLG